ncbi:uncharacterized protein LOC111011638 [Momordica charantia]|uniref:Uncharacterized protein LOC111011638 n=1 Tax=Momordica charantia TaxID=3673 RepID=A0A6J1CJ58_MOMCH|nr:uncharacterized protein LOC111011638 [Momordica charantia]
MDYCRNLAIIVAIFMALSLQTALGESSGRVECESLERRECAFAVSWSGKRCVLEKQVKRSGEEAFTCRTSDIEADQLNDVVETEDCVQSCGLDRNTLGISSDSLLDPRFTRTLCSSRCYSRCPNVVDLFFNLAAGEGVFLPKLCEAQGGNVRREMSEIKSSGIVAPGPIQPVSLSIAPAVAPGPVRPVFLSTAPAVAPAVQGA